MLNVLNLSVVILAITGSVYLYANEDREMDMEHKQVSSMTKTVSKQDTAAKALYQKECGACHMAFQPEFLPKRSWDKMMGSLEKHFGTDATLDTADQKTIQAYLSTYASKNERIVNAKGEDSMRISKTSYFLKEHREIPRKIVIQPEVKSFSNCAACHTQASTGSYREREIRIPNYGRWED